jgi:hypothetical protein
MKIKVNDKIVVDVQVTQKGPLTPGGLAYWQIDYMVGGVCIHSATTGAIHGNPDVVAMLDRQYDNTIYHYQDIPNPDNEPTGDERKNRRIGSGTSSGRPAWWESIEITHRDAIIKAYSQLVID